MSSAVGMTGRELPVAQKPLHRRWQLEKAERVRHRGAALADPVGDGVVGEVEVLDELLVAGGFVERVQSLPVDVLDERLFQARLVVSDLDECGDRDHPGTAGRPPAPLAGDQFVIVVTDFSDEHRLQDPDGTDRVDERGECRFVEGRAGLQLVRPDLRQRNFSHPRRGGFRAFRRDESA